MKNDLTIDISEIAYTKLENLLQSHKNEYSCIRLDYKKTCCKLPPIDIYLDNFDEKKDYFNNNFKNLCFIYSIDLLKNIKKIELIYKNNTFLIKATPQISHTNTCHSCSNCNNCNNNCTNTCYNNK